MMKSECSLEGIKQFFYDNYYKSIVIYGMGYEGTKLYDELCDTDIHILYGIDKNAGNIKVDGLSVVTVDEADISQKVDAIVVTPFKFFAEIEANLEKKYPDGDIISLDDVRKYELIIRRANG